MESRAPPRLETHSPHGWRGAVTSAGLCVCVSGVLTRRSLTPFAALGARADNWPVVGAGPAQEPAYQRGLRINPYGLTLNPNVLILFSSRIERERRCS
jgi:hypothetical protein